MRSFLARDARRRAREAALTLMAALGSLGSAYGLRRAVGLSASVEVLAVALALSLSRVSARPDQSGVRRRLAGVAVLALVAVGASEVGQLLFREPDLGDPLFVLGVSLTVFVRQFGERVRRLAGFAVLPLISVLIVPGVAAVGSAGAGASRWWSALVAVMAFGWVTAVRWGFGESHPDEADPARAARRPRREGQSRWALTGTTKLAVQMAVALAVAFALGRWRFDPHWSWCVLSAFIVSSANRGREDVLHKGVLRVIGAGVGTAGASLIGGLFGAGDVWALVVLFGVLALALWLRPLSYAFWAAGMTAALALLYSYYGESGVAMLGSRLEGIALGAGVAVATAWLLWPIRTGDVIRRDVGAALLALDRLLESLGDDPQLVSDRRLAFRQAAAALEYHQALVSAIPGPLRTRINHLPALETLRGTSAGLEPGDPAAVGALRRRIGGLRKANGVGRLPDPEAWAALAAGLDRLTSSSPPPSSRS